MGRLPKGTFNVVFLREQTSFSLAPRKTRDAEVLNFQLQNLSESNLHGFVDYQGL